MYFFLLVYVTVLYVRPSEIVPALAQVPIVDILTVAGIPIAALSMAMRPQRLIVTPADFCVLGFWAAIVVSNLAWGWFGGAWIGFLNFMPVVFCYILIRASLQTPRQFRGFVYLLVALNLFQAVNGIVQYHTGVGLGGVVAAAGDEHRIRGTGIFNDPNDLGMTLVMTTPFILAAMCAAGSALWRRVFWFAILAPMVLAMYYTNSRGTIIGLGCRPGGVWLPAIPQRAGHRCCGRRGRGHHFVRAVSRRRHGLERELSAEPGRGLGRRPRHAEGESGLRRRLWAVH